MSKGNRGARTVDHVLPDRVAGRAVGERYGIDATHRFECRQPSLLLGTQDLAGPAGGAPSVATEAGNVDLAQNGEVVVACQHDVGPRPDQINALIRACAIADRITQTPESIEAIALCFQHGFERLKVAMDIGDNNDAHRVIR